MRKSSLDGIRQSIGCPCFEFAEDSFDLRPEFLNRVQIRAVRWRVKTVYAGFIQKFFDCLCMVRFHVIHEMKLTPAMVKSIRTLCGVCLRHYVETKAFKIAIVPNKDRCMETCTVCQTRRGYDYVVMPR